MPKSVLWAPWRMSYVTGDKPQAEGCIFCILPARENPRENLVLRASPVASVMLNLYPYNNGHLLVAPRAHVADPLQLDPEAWRGLMDELRSALEVIHRVLRPEGVNVGANLGAAAGAGIAAHLHFHLVPRWNGDTNFMPVVADTKVIPQDLRQTYDLLKPHFT